MRDIDKEIAALEAEIDYGREHPFAGVCGDDDARAERLGELQALRDRQATESDVCLDILAIIDEAPAGRLVGGEETTIQSVGSGERDSIVIVLDNGQEFRLQVRRIR